VWAIAEVNKFFCFLNFIIFNSISFSEFLGLRQEDQMVGLRKIMDMLWNSKMMMLLTQREVQRLLFTLLSLLRGFVLTYLVLLSLLKFCFFSLTQLSPKKL
jgi:hypothetical protein